LRGFGEKFGDKAIFLDLSLNQKSHQAIELSDFLWLRR